MYRTSDMFGRVTRMLDSICQVPHMGKIENIERQDRQLAADIQAGKLDQLVQEARRDHAAGKTTPL